MTESQPGPQIENTRTRVSQTRLAPGEATGFHRHGHDYVIVPITSGTLLLKESGGERTATLESGIAYFREAGVEHDVVNAGAAEVVFVEVELLG